MKNIFKIFAAVFSGMMLFASCQKEIAPLATSINVDQTVVNPEGKDAAPIKVKVTADGDWFTMTSADWIRVDPINGTGNAEVTITVSNNVDSYNELNQPRSGSVSFCYGSAGVAVVEVNQKGEPGLNSSRTYSLVKSNEDITAGNYLVVFKESAESYIALNGKLQNAAYGYAFAEAVNLPVEDVITMPNGALSIAFEASEVTEGAFRMKLPTGMYAYMSGSYNSFNVAAAPQSDNSGDWKLTVSEDGSVDARNVAKDKYIQYSTTHGSAGAYPNAQDGALLPYLYKDAKPATDEVLSVDNVETYPRLTQATINIKSNKTWSIRNHDSWIESFEPKTGNGDGQVTVTFSANTSADARVASFKVIGETTNVDIEFKQLGLPAASKIANIEEEVYSATEGTVVASGDDGAYILADETGAVLVYQKNHGRVVAENVYLEGTMARYRGYNTNALQITPSYTELKSENNTWTYNPKTLDGAAVDALVGKTAVCEEVLVKGVLEIKQSGNYTDLNVTVPGAKNIVFLDYVKPEGYAEFDGKPIIIKGYTVGTYNKLIVLPYSVEIDPNPVVPTPDPVVVKLPYNESFAESQGDFTVEGDSYWSWNSYGYMKASGYVDGQNLDVETKLVSPIIDLTGEKDVYLNFDHATNFFSSVDILPEQATVWARVENGEWEKLSGITYPEKMSWTFVNSGEIDLSAYVGKKMQLAFVYKSTSAKAGTWEVKNVSVTSKSDDGGDTDTVETIVMSDIFSAATNFVDGTTYTWGSLSCTFTKKNNSVSNYNAGDKGVRFYASDILTIEAAKNIVKLEFVTYGGKTGPFTSDVGSVEKGSASNIWTGDANKIVLTASAQIRFKEIKVTYKN